MSQSANVRSIQAIRDFKVAMANFADDARSALSGSEMEIRRIRNWLVRDQVSYWQTQIKRRNEQLSIARTELHRRRLSQQGSDAVSDSEQKEAVKLAQRLLREAEEKYATVKKWVPVLEHAISEYHSTSQPLGDSLAGTLVNSLALLERMVITLENYAATQATSVEISMGGLAPDAAGAAAKSGTTTTATATAEGGDAAAEAGTPAATETAVEQVEAADDREPSHPETNGGPRP